MAKTTAIAEFGDFQTPADLARQVCALLKARDQRPASLLEPTCGLGNLLFAGLDAFSVQTALGFELNEQYVRQAGELLGQRADRAHVTINVGNFFALDWQTLITTLPEPILVLGNPPWVTNSHLATLDSQNLPAKSNFQGEKGLDAITGKANFDICESMLIQLVSALDSRHGTLAMLCKSAVARKVLKHAWQAGLAIDRAAIHRIEADLHFGAAVDAALLVIDFLPGAQARTAEIYGDLVEKSPRSVIGFEDGDLIADMQNFDKWKHLSGGAECLQWRSGIKHDCSKVMELKREGDRFRNGLGELIELEETFIFPMMKSSEVASTKGNAVSRFMLVTQQTVGESTHAIKEDAPKTWAYLQSHQEKFANRRSSIYRNRPAFSIFGVGAYSFAPWKVAISGFYKKLGFVAIGPLHGKPIVLDDTAYFLPCETEEQATYLASVLNSPTAREFYNAFVFWDSKRPITVDLLRRLNLRALAAELGSESEYARLFPRHAHVKSVATDRKRRVAKNLTLWPE